MSALLFLFNFTDWFTCVLFPFSLFGLEAVGASEELHTCLFCQENTHCTTLWLQRCSELARRDLNLVRVAVQRTFELPKSCSLYLVCVLQLFNPFGFLRLQTRDFPLDLHSLFIFFVDATDQFLSLLLTLLFLLHESRLGRFILLVPNHLLHTLGFELFGALLYADHFFVLLALLFESFGFAVVAFGLAHLLTTDGFFLLHAKVLVAYH